MRLAIVIPTLQEEENLRRLLGRAVAIADVVIVSDGGSTDGTRSVAQQAGAWCVCGEQGRGSQLNRGAAAAMEHDADILVFLHADTLLPERAEEEIRRAVDDGAVGGGFFVQFDDRRPLLRLGAWLINFRTRLFRIPLGDQAQFVTRQVFEELGGYRDWPILEDLDFIVRLRRRGKLAIISDPVITAARRFVRCGVFRTVATNWLIWTLYWLGVEPERLARLYRHIR